MSYDISIKFIITQRISVSTASAIFLAFIVRKNTWERIESHRVSNLSTKKYFKADVFNGDWILL